MKKLLLSIAIIFFSFGNAQAQLPTTDIIQVIENLFGISLEGQEIYQQLNELKIQYETVRQEVQGNTELRRLVDTYRQMNEILQNSEINNVENLFEMASGFSSDLGYYQASEFIDILNMNGSGTFDLAEMNFEDLYQLFDKATNDLLNNTEANYEDLKMAYGDLEMVKVGVNDYADKMRLQTAISFLKLSEDYLTKAEDLDLRLNSTIIRNYESQPIDFDFAELTGLFDALTKLLPDDEAFMGMSMSSITNEFGAIANSGFSIAGGSDPLQDIIANYLEDTDGDGTISDEEFQAAAEAMQEDQIEDANGLLETAKDIMGTLLGGVDQLNGLMESINFQAEEPEIIANDAERVQLMDMRNDYLVKSIEYREKATKIIQEVSQGSKKQQSERAYKIAQGINAQFSNLPSIGQ